MRSPKAPLGRNFLEQRLFDVLHLIKCHGQNRLAIRVNAESTATDALEILQPSDDAPDALTVVAVLADTLGNHVDHVVDFDRRKIRVEAESGAIGVDQLLRRAEIILETGIDDPVQRFAGALTINLGCRVAVTYKYGRGNSQLSRLLHDRALVRCAVAPHKNRVRVERLGARDEAGSISSDRSIWMKGKDPFHPHLLPADLKQRQRAREERRLREGPVIAAGDKPRRLDR